MRIERLLLPALLVPRVVLADGAGQQFSFLDQFALGENTFADVQQRLGFSSVTESGDAGGYSARMCFIVSDGFVVHFIAGPLGGPEHYLGGFELERAGSRSLAQCAQSQVSMELTVGGLSLGMTRSDFRRLVDPFGRLASDNTRYLFEHKQMIDRQEFDVSIIVEASFEDDQLVHLRIDKSETN